MCLLTRVWVGQPELPHKRKDGFCVLFDIGDEGEGEINHNFIVSTLKVQYIGGVPIRNREVKSGGEVTLKILIWFRAYWICWDNWGEVSVGIPDTRPDLKLPLTNN